MTMKLLFRHITSLLRTALLLGVSAIFNIQPTLAQTEGLPDAFETIDPATAIGDTQNWYYIQFYDGADQYNITDRSYLSDQGGSDHTARTKDYLPFAKDIQWQLEDAGNNQFYLKSRNGYYIHLDGTTYKCGSTKTALSITKRAEQYGVNKAGGGWDISTSSTATTAMTRQDKKVWANIIDGTHNSHRYPFTRLRVAKLKENITHIIYYQDPIYKEGQSTPVNPNTDTRADAAGYTTHHYLTYSGTNSISDFDNWTSVITNGNLNGSDMSCFYVRANGVTQHVIPSAGYDGNGISIVSAANQEHDYDTQLFIKSNVALPKGTRIHVSFNYQAAGVGSDVSVSAYAQGDPGVYHHWDVIGTVTFPTGGGFFNYYGIVSEEMARDDGMQTIALNLGRTDGSAVTFNIDNITFEVIRPSDVSNRTSIFTTYESWALPTASAYHQDGLWVLEETGTEGEFYIKKFGSTDEYLNVDGSLSILGVKNNEYGIYKLENPSENRFTRLQNVKTSASAPLTTDQFYLWNDVGANSIPTELVNVENHLGEVLPSGDINTVIGDGNVYYRMYADLTGYTKMIFEGTPGTQLRVLMNRQTDGGDYIERISTIGDDGRAELNLTDLTYVHLNAIKINWGSSGTITSINLVKEERSRFLSHSDNGDHEGKQVLQLGNDGNNWQVGFRPVEVPVPNKDEFYQVRLVLNENSSLNIPAEASENIDLNHNVSDNITVSYPGTGLTRFTLKEGAPAYQNAFKYENLETKGYQKIVIKFSTPVPAGWSLHTYGGQQEGNVDLEGMTIYEFNLTNDPVTDFTIYNTSTNAEPITISGCYYYKGKTVDNDGGDAGCMTDNSEANPILWKLEQVDDYEEFRLKAPDGRYLVSACTMSAANDPGGARVYSNLDLLTDFSLKWYHVNSVDKEIRVNHYVTHRESYLKQYSEAHQDLDLGAQGLATEVESDWWNFDGNGFDTPQKGTQKVNHFEITHYVKQGNSMVVEFPTVLNRNNDHIYFQRFYHYDEMDTSMDLDNLKAHVSLDTRDDGDVQYFLYNNGIVTGQKLDWRYYDEGTQTSIDIPDGGMARNEQRRFNFTNSDGLPFTVAVDVSRYSDMTYENSTNPTLGNLEEPSLTMRYLYYMKDAKEMANDLTTRTESYTAVANTTNKYPADEGWYVSDGNGGYTRTTDIEPQPGTTYYARSSWKEMKDFHFPARRIGYELSKKVGYRGEFIGLRHIFSDYWVYDGNGTGNENLVSAVNSNSEGKIEVEIEDPMNLGIRLGGWNPTLSLANNGLKFVDNVDTYSNEIESDFRGFYFYDKMSDANKTEYGNSRFVVFRYPDGGVISQPTYTIVKNGTEIVFHKKAYVNVYLNNNGTRYQLAQFTVIFDPLTQTIPWKLTDTSVTNPDNPTVDNPLKFVEGSYRDPAKLVERAGKPIAKITFDYPANDTYHFSADGETKQGWATFTGGTLSDCSPIPLAFEGDNSKTNYSFSGFECNWGSYSIVNKMTTNYGNHQKAAPANDIIYGYGPTDEEIAANEQLQSLRPDEGLQNGFLYIDASEQPGDICSAPFIGDFCAGDKLMFSGWISGSNKMGGGDNRCPGGITLTVKGEHNLHNPDGSIVYENGKPKKETVTLYRFCPGQCYELDDGPNEPDGSGDSDGTCNVIWQQFYFEFTVSDKYDRHWIEVNNNCVSSQGGDFMLDNVEVYAIVPEVIPGVNTPLCVSIDDDGNEVTDMRLLKLSVDFNKLKASANVNSGTAQIGFAFLDKYKFLAKFKSELAQLTLERKQQLHIDALDFTTITLDELATAIEDGQLESITGDEPAYQNAFDEAIIGNKTTWYSNKPEEYELKKNSSILFFEWNSNFNAMEEYSFYNAVNKTSPVYREVVKGEKFVVMNGNFPQLEWKTNTDYYIINTNIPFESGSGKQFEIFNICSECTKTSVFRIDPPYNILGLEKSSDKHDYIVCEGQIPTLLTDLKGYDFNGNEVDMKDINYDWWLGDPTRVNPNDPTIVVTDPNAPSVPRVKATIEKYHSQEKNGIRLDDALSTLRVYYPDVTDLKGVMEHVAVSPGHALTSDMLNYLQELIDAGQLVLHQKSISIPAEPAGGEDPYFYLVACPIHDDSFERALNPQANEYVAYYCDEPQGLRIKLGDKAPTLKTGFVPNENGFDEYNYPQNSDPVLSIRLAKAAQFETVRHGSVDDNPTETYNTTADNDKHFLWLPIRNAKTQEANGVIRKSADYNIYLASTNDPVWDKKIAAEMKKNGSLPIFGKIVQLYAKNTNGADETETYNLEHAQNGVNRLCIYFVEYEDEKYDVREGYNYTLSLPFQEDGDVNTCDGTILINLKIVPDYEVWTGAAGNTDWNNDENWRRADGNTAYTNTSTELNSDELYVAAAAADSPLYGYTTNKVNYRTAKDRLLRKGFAPLYCTHVLIKSDEWGNAPVLYDAIDGKPLVSGSRLTHSPFPNLRDEDGWDGSTGDDAIKATATPILRYDMQARHHEMWPETYGQAANWGRDGDLLAEMYQINSCDEIAFQSGTELTNAHLLNYNSAWVEYQLDNKRWYLLGSPLQGTISGEWYAPTGTAKQQTTYYDPVKFNDVKPGATEGSTEARYDRYSPAIYQRSWDKAKAVLYEVGSTYSTDDDSQTENLGSANEGIWSGAGNDATWTVEGGGDADEYLDRLGYKPMGGKKANVAIKGIWSNTYNDAQVDYANGGFSVMVMNHLKNNDDSNGKSIIRLPKEDTMYNYYEFSEDGKDDGGTDTYLIDHDNKQGVQTAKNRAKNRGRLKTDNLLPATVRVEGNNIDIQKTETAVSIYGDARNYTRIPIKEKALQEMNYSFLPIVGDGDPQPPTAGLFTETVAAGISHLNYYLVENPFPCGLDMDAFFEANKSVLQQKYWLLTADGQHLVQKAADQDPSEWISPTISTADGDLFATADGVVAPGQGFFVQAKTATDESITITFNKDMQAQTRYGVQSGNPRTFTIEVGQTQDVEDKVIDIDINGNGILGETYVEDGQTIVEQETVQVPKYQKENGEYVLDEEGNKIPVLIPITQDIEIYNYVQTSDNDYKYPLQGRTRGEEAEPILQGLVITAERGGNQSSALVMQRDKASNDFLPSEDTETFITSDFENVPTVYTLCGRLATTINSIHDFRSLSVGVESNSDAPCVLTFQGVEMLGDSISFYDAVEQTLTPLQSGMQFSVSGQTQNRYYLVRSLIQEEAAAETHLQIFTEGLTAKVIASTAEPIVSVRCFDTAGRLLHTASPQTSEYSFTLPIAGIYIIEAETENDRKTKKVMAR